MMKAERINTISAKSINANYEDTFWRRSSFTTNYSTYGTKFWINKTIVGISSEYL